MKTKDQILSALSLVDADKSNYAAMTYEQGVEEALLWVLGELLDGEFSFDPEQKR
jgi:hypothetical protein